MEAIRSKKRPKRLSWPFGASVCLLGILVSGLCSPVFAGVGVWIKEPADVPQGLTPDFLIAKFAVFGRRGNVRFVWSNKEIKHFCQQKIPVTAWVTHRLSPGEVLGEEAAMALAARLESHSARRCLAAVELNIEPLTQVPPWFVRFLAAVNKGLSVPLRLAVPPVFEGPMPGYHWTASDMRAVAEVLDGIDFMLYDMGLPEKEYNKVLETTLEFAEDFLRKHSGKSVLLGLPAYHDKTSLHPLEVENVAKVSSMLRAMPVARSRAIYCHPGLSVAYYAGWTMKPDEVKAARTFEAWRKDVCL